MSSAPMASPDRCPLFVEAGVIRKRARKAKRDSLFPRPFGLPPSLEFSPFESAVLDPASHLLLHHLLPCSALLESS